MVFGNQPHHYHSEKSHNKQRPTHFPITPFLQPPPVPSLPRQYLVDNRSLRVSKSSKSSNLASMDSNASSRRKDSFERRQEPPSTSIYESFSRISPAVPRSDPRPSVRASGLLSPLPTDRLRYPSRSSSIDNFGNPPSIYSPSSTATDLTETLDAHLRQSVLSSDGGYDSSSTVGRAGRRNRSNVREQMRHAEVLEEHADEDKASARISIGSKIKADKLLGLAAPTAGLASAYICSGLGVVSPYIHAPAPPQTPPGNTADISYPKHGHSQTLTRSEASNRPQTRWVHSGDPKSYTMPFQATR